MSPDKKIVNASSCSEMHRSDLNIKLWRVWTFISPQDISYIVRFDSDEHEVSLRLQNDSGDTQFIWKDWMDAAMECMKGFEEGGNGDDR